MGEYFREDKSGGVKNRLRTRKGRQKVGKRYQYESQRERYNNVCK